MTTKPFIEHLYELRYRLMICCCSVLFFSVFGFFVYAYLIEWLSFPFITDDNPLYITHLLEGFVTKFKCSLLFGFIFSTPVFIFHFIRFSFPGLRHKEKKIFVLLLFFGVLLSVLSFYLSYFHLLPYSISFLTSQQFIPSDVGLLLNFQENIFYVFNVLFYAVLLFQFPIVMFLFLYYGLVTSSFFLKGGRFFILGIVIVSAVITPPDLLSQVVLSVPLIFLYYFVILLAKLFKLGEQVHV